MRLREYNWKIEDYENVMCMVTGVNWEAVAQPNYDDESGIPRDFNDWFKGAIIKVRKPDGQEGMLRIPQDLKQQSHYRYYAKEPDGHGLVSGYVGGPVNKDSGWKGDNVTLISPECSGVYHWVVTKDDDSGERLVDASLEPEINQLISLVSNWSQD